MDYESYSIESARTASGEFHEEVVPRGLLNDALHCAFEVGSVLDGIKKGFFYGKPLSEDFPMGSDSGRTIDPRRIDIDILHAALGVLTESIEILEALREGMKGKPLDRVNLVEELGDIEWYMAMFYRALGTTPERVREINIAKLRARYPHKFTEHDAVNRDLARERNVLEGVQ